MLRISVNTNPTLGAEVTAVTTNVWKLIAIYDTIDCVHAQLCRKAKRTDFRRFARHTQQPHAPRPHNSRSGIPHPSTQSCVKTPQGPPPTARTGAALITAPGRRASAVHIREMGARGACLWLGGQQDAGVGWIAAGGGGTLSRSQSWRAPPARRHKARAPASARRRFSPLAKTGKRGRVARLRFGGRGPPHLVPERLGQAEALLERDRPRARHRTPLALAKLELLLPPDEPTKVERRVGARQHAVDRRLDAARVDLGARRNLGAPLQLEAVHQHRRLALRLGPSHVDGRLAPKRLEEPGHHGVVKAGLRTAAGACTVEHERGEPVVDRRRERPVDGDTGVVCALR
eukprot:883054-Prymnesium_polylepis.1